MRDYAFKPSGVNLKGALTWAPTDPGALTFVPLVCTIAATRRFVHAVSAATGAPTLALSTTALAIWGHRA